MQGDQSSGEIQVIGGDNFEKLKGKVSITSPVQYSICMTSLCVLPCAMYVECAGGGGKRRQSRVVAGCNVCVQW